MDSTPQEDEVWRTSKGTIREVTYVSGFDPRDDGRYDWVHYRRPPPAQEEYATTTLKLWREWVEREGAVRIRRAWRAA